MQPVRSGGTLPQACSSVQNWPAAPSSMVDSLALHCSVVCHQPGAWALGEEHRAALGYRGISIPHPHSRGFSWGFVECSRKFNWLRFESDQGHYMPGPGQLECDAPPITAKSKTSSRLKTWIAACARPHSRAGQALWRVHSSAQSSILYALKHTVACAMPNATTLPPRSPDFASCLASCCITRSGFTPPPPPRCPRC